MDQKAPHMEKKVSLITILFLLTVRSAMSEATLKCPWHQSRVEGCDTIGHIDLFIMSQGVELIEKCLHHFLEVQEALKTTPHVSDLQKRFQALTDGLQQFPPNHHELLRHLDNCPVASPGPYEPCGKARDALMHAPALLIERIANLTMPCSWDNQDRIEDVRRAKEHHHWIKFNAKYSKAYQCKEMQREYGRFFAWNQKYKGKRRADR